MRVLSVGGGAREHAMVKALDRGGAEIFAVMKNRNPGIARLSKDFSLQDECNVDSVCAWAAKKKVELAVIGPEAPLAAGLVDALADKGISSVGPDLRAARIESSKEYMRNLMKERKLPGTIEYGVFEDLDRIKDFMNAFGKEVVVKPIGLAAGKGAKVMGEHLHTLDDVMEYCKMIIQNNIGGTPRVVIEEKIEGEEFTFQCFCDGKNVAAMPLVQDHKRAYEGDRGPNTGGMGSYSQADHLLPFLTKDDMNDALDIIKKVVAAMRDDGNAYKGILYGQFMLTKSGPQVIEFNARFGDPEAMNVLPLLEDNFVDVCQAIAGGGLKALRFRKEATVCKYIVPEGYGVKSAVGEEIAVNEKKIEGTGAELFYASVNEKDGKVYTTSSRSLGVVGFGGSIGQAEAIAEKALEHVSGNVFIRHDIGKDEAIRKKVQHMEAIRG
jgi:phosphoribosylamine--glycine ligase